MVTGMFGALTTLSALVSFYDGCLADIDESIIVIPGENTPDGIAIPIEIDFTTDVGFNCLLVACLLKFVDVACHVVVPTPKYVQSGFGYSGSAENV